MQPNQAQWDAPPQPGWGSPVVQQQTAEEPPDPDDLLGGGYKSAQFPDRQYGHTVGGRIIARPKTTQQRDFQTKALKFYPDSGKPAWQIVVPVQAQRPAEDDDGTRAFYLKGQMKQAVTLAIRQAAAERLEVGGDLQIRYVRDEVGRNGGMPQKIYEARYTPPAGQAAPQTPPARTGGSIEGLPMNSPPPGTRSKPSTFDDVAPF